MQPSHLMISMLQYDIFGFEFHTTLLRRMFKLFMTILNKNHFNMQKPLINFKSKTSYKVIFEKTC